MQDPNWSKLSYYNPTKYLRTFDSVANSLGITRFKHPADILLRRQVRYISEDRRCAIFCHGAGQAFGKKILFAPHENADYDYVGAYEYQGAVSRFPIQLKQLVPDRLNSATSLQAELDKLRKYSGSSDLVVAVHVNRTMFIRPKVLNVSDLKLKEIWLFGQFGKRSSTWLLFGNLMRPDPIGYSFELPAV